MRKLPVVLVAALLLTAGNLFANDSNTTDPKKELAIQISHLLEDNFFVLNDHDLTANVLFTLNKDMEIVVISVDSEDEVLERFVKSRLNYQAVDIVSWPKKEKCTQFLSVLKDRYCSYHKKVLRLLRTFFYFYRVPSLVR